MFLVPVAAVLLYAGFTHYNRLIFVQRLGGSGVAAVFETGRVTREDIREYFQYPPVDDSPILAALELTPEDLAGLSEETPAWLRDELGQLLIGRVVKHIALMKYLNVETGDEAPEAIEREVLEYKHGLMAAAMEEEFEAIDPDVTDEEVMDYYLDNRDEFHQEGRRLARHLMIPDPDSDGDGTGGSERADAILERLRRGEDFASLVAAESESESRDYAGFLGWQPRSAFAGPFDDALWAMEIGEITGPVRAGGSIHFIQLLDEQPRGLLEFEECAPEIREILKDVKRGAIVRERLELPPGPSDGSAEEIDAGLYRRAVLDEAYKHGLNEDLDIIKQTKAYSKYKKADYFFRQRVEDNAKDIGAELDWTTQHQTAERLLETMDFHFTVRLNQPSEEPAA